MESKERIDKLLDYIGLGPVNLAVKAGLPRTRIADIQKERVKKITYETADAICRVYPTISKDWLLSGEGDMLVHQQEDTTPKTDNSMAKMFSSVATLMEKMAEIVERMDSRQEQSEERYAKLVERIIEFAEEKEQNRKSSYGDNHGLLSDSRHQSPDKQKEQPQNT